MARKETPDVLAALLSGAAPDTSPTPAPTAPPKPGPRPSSPATKAPKPAKPAAAAPAPSTVQWDYLVVSLAEKNGWRPRYIGGKEVKSWASAPVIHDFIAQMGADGWELAAAAAGKALYGSSDNYQLYFKRVLRAT